MFMRQVKAATAEEADWNIWGNSGTTMMTDASKEGTALTNDPLPGVPMSALAQYLTKSNAASQDQIELVKRVEVGTTISVYRGEMAEYRDALVTRWRRRRGVTLFRLLYDDGYGEDDVNLLREKFRLVHVEEAKGSDGVPTGWGEGGMIFV